MSREHSVTYVSGTDTRTDGAQGRNRTTDTAIFSRMLYQLSYLGGGVIGTKMGIAEPGAGIKRLAQCQAGCATEPRPSLNGRFGLAGELWGNGFAVAHNEAVASPLRAQFGRVLDKLPEAVANHVVRLPQRVS